MSTKPEYTNEGVLVIPAETFYAWCRTFLPAGVFYSFGVVMRRKDDSGVVVAYASSTAGTPPPPGSGAEQLPAPVPPTESGHPEQPIYTPSPGIDNSLPVPPDYATQLPVFPE